MAAASTGWSSGDKTMEVLQDSWPQIALKLGVTVGGHPLDLAKTLIQVGHEPLAPKHTKTWMGKPKLSLPSVFLYMGHIRRQDGFFGLYRGLGPKLVTMGVSSVVSDQFAQHWPKSKYEDKSDEELTEEEKQQKAIDAVIKDIMERLAIIAVTQPLQVVTIRAMASFVGNENEYSNVLTGLASIYRENGILGFWSGWMPRALGEALVISISAGLAYLAKSYVDKVDPSMKPYTSHIAGFIASSLCYPFTVVSNCAIVSRSGLAAGYPPNMPFYGDWVDIFRQLSRENQLKRGSSLLFRYYTGPQVVIDNRVVPLNPKFSVRKEL